MTRTLFLRRFLFILLFLLLLLVAGTVAFLQFPGWSFSDALYMTVITLTAVGYEEVRPLTDAGRITAGFLLAGGITAMGLWFALLTSAIVEMDLGETLRIRRKMKRLRGISDHVIVCGAGRTGKEVLRELIATGASWVSIETDPDRAERTREMAEDALVLEADATRDETLKEAGIERARGLVAALDADSDNLFVCLTARALNPELTIVARANDEATLDKMYRAGADHVVSPAITGGTRMASMLLRPEVMSFLDVVTRGAEFSLRLEGVRLPPGSPFEGRTLQEAEIPQKTGLIVIAISHGDGGAPDALRYNPGSDEEMRAGDELIVLGNPEQVDGLRAIVAP